VSPASRQIDPTLASDATPVARPARADLNHLQRQVGGVIQYLRSNVWKQREPAEAAKPAEAIEEDKL
jgi:hypothetical protein